jgi:hypothetical protein
MDQLRVLIARRKALINEVNVVNSKLANIYENCFLQIASGETNVDDILQLITNGAINMEEIRHARRKAAIAESQKQMHETRANRIPAISDPVHVETKEGYVLDTNDIDELDDNVSPPIPTRQQMLDAISNSDEYKRKLEADQEKLNKFKEVHLKKSESERKEFLEKMGDTLRSKLQELMIVPEEEKPRQELARTSDIAYYKECINILESN